MVTSTDLIIGTVVGEHWGAFFCLVPYFLLLFHKDKSPKDDCVRRMLLACAVLLFSDSISRIFDGHPGDDALVVLRLSTYVMYASCYVIMAIFTRYVWEMVRQDGDRPPVGFRILWLLVVLAIVALTVGACTDLFYYFDENNVYHRSKAYVYSQLITVLGVVVLAWATVRYRNRLTKNEMIASFSYILLPPLGTIVQAHVYGLAFQEYGFALATLITVFVREADIREGLMRATQKEAEGRAALEEALARADAASRAKTSFLFSMSHDIRTPMNAIVGYTDLIEKNYGDEEKFRDYLAKAKSANGILLSMVNNVLEMASIESGKARLNEEVWSLEEILKETSYMFVEQMEKKGVSFTRDVDFQTKFVRCDAAKIREVYLNILSNAVKYTPSGGRIDIYLHEHPSDKPGFAKLVGKVSDTGIGMSEEFLPHLFDEFSREESTTSSGIEGTGLGMPIVNRLMGLLDGTIEVESELGRGTTFTLALYLEIADEPQEVSEDDQGINLANLVGKRVLLAEDNDLNAEIASELLGEFGLELERAEDGAECVEMLVLAEAGYYDLVLMDVQMPNMNGYEATKAIRSLQDCAKAQVPIVAMTANAFDSDKQNALEAGMDGHVAKPIDVPELLKVLCMHL